MNKTAIKNFAIWARRKLISDITYKAGMLGVSENGIAEPLPQSTKDLQFFDIGTKDYAEVSGAAIDQRNALVSVIQAKEQSTDYKTAFRSVIEEVAYTWFNRLIAVRFMEVNDYLPSRIRVLSSESAGKLEPDFVTTPFETDLEFSAYEKDRVYQLKDENKLDELFRMLFIKQCNKLSEILPGLFEQISDYTELLLNISFTDKDGIVYHLTHDIAEDEFNVEKEGQVEIIGWLYQYYNTEPKDEVFALLKKNVKITKERIPAATQLFTPDWIVRYMVENSLGRLWVEGHPNESLKGNWKYYLEEAEQEPDVIAQLKKIREEYALLNPTDIKVIDPCMGSGHILVYAFDVLMQIYKSQGYVERDAAKSILINNLYGIDIDTRAYQLAYFAVMMKARQYNRKIFNEGIIPNLIAIRNPADVSKSVLKRLGGLEPVGLRLVEDFEDAEEYGSILQPNVTLDELDRLEKKLAEVQEEAQYGNLLLQMEAEQCVKLVSPLVKQGRLLVQKYDVVVTNPPYMVLTNCSDKLTKFIKSHYSNTRYDMYGVFIEKCQEMTSSIGYRAMITQQSWLTLGSYEELRGKVFNNSTISSMVQIGYNTFPELNSKVAQGVSFVTRNKTTNYLGCYLDLNTAFSAAYNKQEAFFESHDGGKYYYVPQEVFLNLPGKAIVFNLKKSIYRDYSVENKLSDYGLTRLGMTTADNARFTRLWYEVSINKCIFNASCVEDVLNKRKKWIPYNKGGQSVKWYGNMDCLVNWENDGFEIRNITDEKGKIRSTVPNTEYYFKPCLTWSKISWNIAFRYRPQGSIFDVAGASFFPDRDMFSLMGFLNSSIVDYLLSRLSPTLNFEGSHIGSLPVKSEVFDCMDVERITSENIDLCVRDWDLFETSWDFKEHPFVWYSRGLWDVTRTMANLSYFYGSAPKVNCPLEICWLLWQGECNERFNKLKANEEELNRIFIDIYGLQDELMPDVADKDVTVRKADLGRDMRSFVSYAVGCMFGRYSLDRAGVVLAGQKFDSRYAHNPEGYQYGDRTVLNGDYLIDDDGSQIKCSFVPDMDNCIPITDEEYFADDIVGRFVEFVRVVYGSEKLEENLDFVAAALGNKGNTSREVIRNYFLNDFYKDHLKVYQKRPIYWLFDSGKQNGFKALVYMHRWNSDTVGNLRIEYLHKMQTVYEREIENCQDMIDHASGRDVAVAVKRKEKLVKQLKECRDYDALVAHIAFSKIDIDLDDGVKVNYRKVQTGADGKFCEILANSKDIMAKEK